MPTLRLELDEQTVERMTTERELLGFETITDYLAWIVSNRTAIQQGSERDQLLSEYAKRVETLEAQLDAGEAIDPDEPIDVDRGRRRAEANADGGTVADGESTSGSTATADGGTETATADGPEAGSQTATTNGAGAGSQTADGSGAGTQTTLDGTGASAGGTDADTRAGDTAGPAETVDGGGFSPERVTRMTDERLTDDVDELAGVESNRLDELARRAVARTRKRLGRDVGTGLDYRSQTGIEDDMTPGEDITDLDDLEVPGFSDDPLEARREAVGAALAFLRDEERARRSDFVDALFEEYPAGYDTTDSWWRCIKRGLKQVESVAGGDGSRVWRFSPRVERTARGVTVTRISNDG
jgi:hypothetical protein